MHSKLLNVEIPTHTLYVFQAEHTSHQPQPSKFGQGALGMHELSLHQYSSQDQQCTFEGNPIASTCHAGSQSGLLFVTVWLRYAYYGTSSFSL